MFKFWLNARHIQSLVTSFFLVGAFLLQGCSDPKSFEVTKITESQRKELGEKLTSDEGQKLAGWMMRNGIAGKEPPAGLTVSQAIKEQDEWVAKQKEELAKAEELKKKVQVERKLKQEEFANLLSVVVVAKRNSTGDYNQRWVVFDIAFQNKGSKDIAGAKTTMRVADMFGDKIFNLGWSFDQGVDAGKTSVERGSGLKVNQFMDDHMKIWNSDLDKLKITFDIHKIIFKDGSSIDSPD